MKKLLKATEIAEIYNVSRKTIYNWVSAGMPVIRLGEKGMFRFDFEEVQKWLLTNKQK